MAVQDVIINVMQPLWPRLPNISVSSAFKDGSVCIWGWRTQSSSVDPCLITACVREHALPSLAILLTLLIAATKLMRSSLRKEGRILTSSLREYSWSQWNWNSDRSRKPADHSASKVREQSEHGLSTDYDVSWPPPMSHFLWERLHNLPNSTTNWGQGSTPHVPVWDISQWNRSTLSHEQILSISLKPLIWPPFGLSQWIRENPHYQTSFYVLEAWLSSCCSARGRRFEFRRARDDSL